MIYAQHGFEDEGYADGIEVVDIAYKFMDYMYNNREDSNIQKILSNWTIYAVPYLNRDGITSGSSENGPGRCNVKDEIDINRNWPTKIYVKSALSLIDNVNVKGISHITGGGFYENMPRMLRDGVALNIDVNSYPRKPIFDLLQKTGNIPTRDMFNTFNMGIGMAVIVPENEVEQALKILKDQGEEAYLIGEVVEGNKEINLNI